MNSDTTHRPHMKVLIRNSAAKATITNAATAAIILTALIGGLDSPVCKMRPPITSNAIPAIKYPAGVWNIADLLLANTSTSWAYSLTNSSLISKIRE